ncbi:nucleotidyltransferase family protein [Microbulbifer pacificus]|uniref:nucleotidyltransferase family protein n=1 Tax=Microbulbifer pacificus TaxID=407164 RepID=UPI0018F872F2|nr:nucleotidyltransferase family protein [Microbulbifer pacificus]
MCSAAWLAMRFNGTVALVMAAGCSRRFGSADKRRALLPNGQPLLLSTVARVRAFFPHWRLVWRCRDDLESFGLPAHTPVIHAPGASGGLGCSLADAACAIRTDPLLATVDSAAIFLGDMPAIRRDTLSTLLAQTDRSAILRPTYRGQVGHPVVFGRDFWDELAALDGDTGARNLIRRFHSHYRELSVSDPGVTFDIDTTEDIDQTAH